MIAVSCEVNSEAITCYFSCLFEAWHIFLNLDEHIPINLKVNELVFINNFSWHEF